MNKFDLAIGIGGAAGEAPKQGLYIVHKMSVTPRRQPGAGHQHAKWRRPRRGEVIAGKLRGRVGKVLTGWEYCPI